MERHLFYHYKTNINSVFETSNYIIKNENFCPFRYTMCTKVHANNSTIYLKLMSTEIESSLNERTSYIWLWFRPEFDGQIIMYINGN